VKDRDGYVLLRGQIGLIPALEALQTNVGTPSYSAYDGDMPCLSEHLTSLRQEITDLRNLNAQCSEKIDHTALDQSALELRTNRLREIKLELSKMLNPPTDPKVWWDGRRSPNPTHT